MKKPSWFLVEYRLILCTIVGKPFYKEQNFSMHNKNDVKFSKHLKFILEIP